MESWILASFCLYKTNFTTGDISVRVNFEVESFKSAKDVWEAAFTEQVLRLVFLRSILIVAVGTFSPVFL